MNRTKNISIISFFLSVLAYHSYGQVDTIGNFTMNAYADVYTAHYTDSVGQGNFQKFPSISPRSDNIGLNTIMISSQYSTDKMRATAVFHYGDIANSTWSSTSRNIMEAHIGIRLTKKLWLDAGYFRTHFGTEYLLPIENITSSVTVNTYYEPYFESGFRLNFDPSKDLDITLYFLNGYGMFEDNNKKKSLGTSITYILNENGSLCYTNYIGDDSPPEDSVSHLRIAQNIYLTYQWKKIKLIVGGDLYLQKNSSFSTNNTTASMWNVVATARYSITPNFGIYARGERFSDPDGFMTGIITDRTGKQTGLMVSGITGGIEYKPTSNSYIRLEGRYLQMEENQAIFYYNGTLRNYRYEIMVNMGITFEMINSILTKNK